MSFTKKTWISSDELTTEELNRMETGINDVTNDVTTLMTEPAVYVIGVGGAPSFQNSWENYGSTYAPARYWIDAHGEVTVEAALQKGTDGTVAFTLPAGFRPEYDCYEPASAGLTNPGRVIVQQGGDVVVNRNDSSSVMFRIHFKQYG